MLTSTKNLQTSHNYDDILELVITVEATVVFNSKKHQRSYQSINTLHALSFNNIFNVAGTSMRSSQQGQNLFTNTHSQLLLARVPGTCRHKVLHYLSSSCHTKVLSPSHVPPKFIWSNFMWHVSAINVPERTFFIV